jgi:hypothetical protein
MGLISKFRRPRGVIYSFPPSSAAPQTSCAETARTAGSLASQMLSALCALSALGVKSFTGLISKFRAPDGWPLTWHPSASSRTARRLLLQMPRSSCIVLHGVDLKISPSPGVQSILSRLRRRLPRTSCAETARTAGKPRFLNAFWIGSEKQRVDLPSML